MWELGFEKVYVITRTDKRGSLCLIVVQTMLFMANTCFSSERLEFLYVLGRRYFQVQPPIKSLGTESLMRFNLSLVHISYVLLQFGAGRTKYMLPNSTGKGLLKHSTRLVYVFPNVPFFLCLFSFVYYY